jgi:serine protease Do
MSAVAALPTLRPLLHTAIGTELESLAEKLRSVTVRIHTGSDRFDAVGAGILWPSASRQLVVTNAHVVPPRRGDEPEIEVARGQRVASRVIARDAEVDLAVLMLTGAPNEYGGVATIGQARRLRVGEVVVALGHPLGVGGALSVGVVHAVPNDGEAWLRADIRLAPGNSGGPLASLDGAIVGINCMIVGGLGIAVPVQVAESFVRDALGAALAAAP